MKLLVKTEYFKMDNVKYNIELMSNIHHIYTPRTGETYQCNKNMTENSTIYTLDGWKVMLLLCDSLFTTNLNYKSKES